jgi:hypothetical protein
MLSGKRRYVIMKRAILAIIAVYVMWSLLDIVIHGLILSSSYQETSQLWRPEGEMKMYLIYITVLILAIAFVTIYARYVSAKSVTTGLSYGLIFGLGLGISMAYGSYAVMPIPYSMAFTWFIGTLVEMTLGGLIMGLIIGKGE